MTDIEFIKHIEDKLESVKGITIKKMFGEYGVWHEGKFVAGICNNQFFLKVTDAGKKLIANPEYAPPYEGASLYFLISDLDDEEKLKELITNTSNVLPIPRPRKKNSNKKSTSS